MELLELSIANPMQLFNSMDPAPFRERDLDAEVVAYIVEWANIQALNSQLALCVSLHQAPNLIVGWIHAANGARDCRRVLSRLGCVTFDQNSRTRPIYCRARVRTC